ncbi:MAG TPA: hypothetical protein VHO70_09975 [Chitinispirillaceae bacterium]|nr:hypothetical protein [Chitinispirillaceae bacterium]
MKVYTFFIVCLFLCAKPVISQKKHLLQSDNMFFTGLHLSVSPREGTFYLNGGKTFDVSPSPLYKGGVQIGKRIPLGPGFRIAAPLEVSIGSTWEDIPDLVLLDDGRYEELILKKMYITIGLIPLLQYAIPLQNQHLKSFLSAGGGIHYSVYVEDERLKNDTYYRISDPEHVEDARRFVGSGDFGFGIDWMLSKRQAISLAYTFRIWKPIDYKTRRDLFPASSIRYTEMSFTNIVSVQFLVRLF